jgi:serine/threonine protein phosphatase PrpC
VAGPARRERLDGGPGGELDARPGAEADAAAADSSQAITAWIGPDAPASRPHQGTWEVTRPGWLLACTDGLWNYLCDPQALRTALRDDSADGLGVTDRHDPGDGDPTPQTLADTVAGPSALALASALVARANDLGGRDNITVALARWDHDTSAGRRPALETTR